MPDLPDLVTVSIRSALLLKFAREKNLTIRQLALHIAGSRGHWTLVGTAAEIVDQLEEWFLKRGADGFNYMPPLLPGSLDDFVTLVVPELQRRGIYRSQYEGRTLREILGYRAGEPLSCRTEATQSLEGLNRIANRQQAKSGALDPASAVGAEPWASSRFFKTSAAADLRIQGQSIGLRVKSSRVARSASKRLRASRRRREAQVDIGNVSLRESMTILSK